MSTPHDSAETPAEAAEKLHAEIVAKADGVVAPDSTSVPNADALTPAQAAAAIHADVQEKAEQYAVEAEQTVTVVAAPVVDPVVGNRETLYRRPSASVPIVDVEDAVAAPVEVSAPVERDRASERAERNRTLGVVERPAEKPAEVVTPVAKPKRTTDKWHGSLAFLVIRVLAAGILGFRGYQHLYLMSDTRQFLAHSLLPQHYLTYFVWGLGIVELLIAFLLLLGFLTRFAGLLLLALECAILTLFVYGKTSPFSHPPTPANQIPNILTYGIRGETELLLAGQGLIFLLLGAGGWAIDAGLRRSRARNRALRDAGDIN